MTVGRGVCAEIDGEKIMCGNKAYMRENGVRTDDAVHEILENMCKEGKAAVLLVIDGVCIGVLAMSDVLRSDSRETVEKLKEFNCDIALLTGDNKETADYFARKSGIENVYAGLLPKDKVECIKRFEEKGKNVCMVGDGVNDAPALKTADVGIAMGGLGSDIAVEAADIVLMSDGILNIPYLKRLSNATIKTIKLSITLSMCINFIAVLLSVLGMLNPTSGELVHNAGSCFVVLIAALLYDRKFE